MRIPYEVAFHGMERSEAVESWVESRLERLSRHHERIQRCRVVVDAPHRHKKQGALFEVRIELTAPGDHLSSARGKHDNHAYEDVYVALRDAFDALERTLDKQSAKARGDVKSHGAD